MNKTEEKIKQLEFEISALAESILSGSSERWVPGFVNKQLDQEHTNRYLFAKSYCDNKSVLDIACGCGFGSKLLAEIAETVIGVDISSNAVEYAKTKYHADNLYYRIGDAECSDLGSFDIITSFETIEHLHNTDQYMRNLSRNLKNDGIIIISTPISNKQIDYSPENKYHIVEWGFDEFKSLCSNYYENVTSYIQMYPVIYNNKKIQLYQKIIKMTNILKGMGADYKYIDKKINMVIPFDERMRPILNVRNGYVGYQICVCTGKK